MPREMLDDPSQSSVLHRVAILPNRQKHDEIVPARGNVGVCIITPEGNVGAADAVVARWLELHAPYDHERRPKLSELVGEGEAAGWLDQLFGPQKVEVVEAKVLIRESPALEMYIEIRRLEGPDGPLAVATFRRAAIEALAGRDALTGLADRRAIGLWAAGLQGEGIGESVPHAVLFLDLDDFKQVNDAHGHAAGDVALAELAERWRNAVRDGDLVTRYGGDEFVILLKNVADRDAVETIIERLQAATMAPVAVAGRAIIISATVGIAISDAGQAPIEHLIVAADQDMYARKRQRPK